MLVPVDGKRRAGAAVANRRGELGLTQKQLATEAGIAERTIGDLERGARWPNPRTRASIDNALGWPAGELHRIATRDENREPEVPESLMRQVAALTPRQRKWMRDWLARELREDGNGPPRAAQA